MALNGISSAVERVDRIQITPELGRRLVLWLGRYAELAVQRNGCAPEGLVEAQHAIFEAVVGDSRQCELERSAAQQLLVLGHEEHVDAERAGELLGLTAAGARWNWRRGNLKGHRVGRQVMITVASIEQLKNQRSAG